MSHHPPTAHVVQGGPSPQYVLMPVQPSGYAAPVSGFVQFATGYPATPSGYPAAASGYAATPPVYAAAPSGYAASPSGYAVGYAAPAVYAAPAGGYAPAVGYAAAPSGYSGPAVGYSGPASGYSAHAPGYSAHAPGYPAPAAGHAPPLAPGHATPPGHASGHPVSPFAPGMNPTGSFNHQAHVQQRKDPREEKEQKKKREEEERKRGENLQAIAAANKEAQLEEDERKKEKRAKDAKAALGKAEPGKPEPGKPIIPGAGRAEPVKPESGKSSFLPSIFSRGEKYATTADLRAGLEKLKAPPGILTKPSLKPGNYPAPVAPKEEPLDPREKSLLEKCLKKPTNDNKPSQAVDWGWIFLEMIFLLKPDSPWRQAVWENYTTSYHLTTVLLTREVEFTSQALPAVMKSATTDSPDQMVGLMHHWRFLTTTALSGLKGGTGDPVAEAVTAVFQADINGLLIPQVKDILNTGLGNKDAARVSLACQVIANYLKKETTTYELFRCDAFTQAMRETAKWPLEVLNELFALFKEVIRSCNALLATPLYTELVEKIRAFCDLFTRCIEEVYNRAFELGATDKFFELLITALQAAKIQGLPETIAKSHFLLRSLEAAPKEVTEALKALL